jgi:hypothetical protein
MKPLGPWLVFLLAVVALTFLSVRYGLGRLPVIVSVILSAVLWLFRR